MKDDEKVRFLLLFKSFELLSEVEVEWLCVDSLLSDDEGGFVLDWGDEGFSWSGHDKVSFSAELGLVGGVSREDSNTWGQEYKRRVQLSKLGIIFEIESYDARNVF